MKCNTLSGLIGELKVVFITVNSKESGKSQSFFIQRLDEACFESLDDINNKDRLLLVCTAMETLHGRKGKMVVFFSTFVCPSYVTKIEF